MCLHHQWICLPQKIFPQEWWWQARSPDRLSCWWWVIPPTLPLLLHNQNETVQQLVKNFGRRVLPFTTTTQPPDTCPLTATTTTTQVLTFVVVFLSPSVKVLSRLKWGRLRGQLHLWNRKGSMDWISNWARENPSTLSGVQMQDASLRWGALVKFPDLLLSQGTFVGLNCQELKLEWASLLIQYIVSCYLLSFSIFVFVVLQCILISIFLIFESYTYTFYKLRCGVLYWLEEDSVK